MSDKPDFVKLKSVNCFVFDVTMSTADNVACVTRKLIFFMRNSHIIYLYKEQCGKRKYQSMDNTKRENCYQKK